MRKKFLKSKRGDFFIHMIVMFICIMFTSSLLLAQTNSSIMGRVFDSSSEKYLPGANIFLEGTSYGAASDRSGEYRIQNVPPGTYVLKVSYIGYADYSAEITVTGDGSAVIHDAALKGSFLEAEEIVVVGLRQGQAKALSQQKTATNIKNVVDQEQMQQFPDINSAEVLQRVPGVNITRDMGEGRYVQVRGTEARLNSMKINGEAIPSPEGKIRNVMMDVIPANQLSTIEVTKAITPDMDGDAIGGSVNLITKSAFDYDKPVLNVTAGGGYADIRGQGIYQGDINYGRVLGDNQDLGIMLSASYLRTDRGADNNEMKWGSEEDTSGVEIPWALGDVQLRHYTVRRDRLGFSGGLDYRPSEANKYSFKAIYNKFDDSEQRNRLRFRPSKGDYNSATNVSEGKIERHLKDRDQIQTLYSLMGKGENRFGDLSLDYTLSYSYAEEDEGNHWETTFKLDEKADMLLNLSDTNNPQVNLTNLAPNYELDASHYEFDDIEIHDNLTTNKEFTASFNLKVPYTFSGYSSDLKLGGKLSTKKKDRDENIWVYEWDGADDVLMSQFVGEDKAEEFLDDKYQMGAIPDNEKIRDWYAANKDGLLKGEINREDTDGGTYNADENVYAVYAMTTVNFDNLMLLAGVRDEITKTTYTGNEVLFDANGDYASTKSVTSEKDHNHILPMIHLKYKATPQTNIRAAITSGIARPNYFDLAPYKLIFAEDGEMENGNPNLKPTTAYNFDLLAEHYFQGIGIISGGFFYKSLSDIIYESTYEQVGGAYDGYTVFQSVNGGDATLYGFELNWQQQLSFLPGFLNGFGIYMNYTITSSKADLPGRDDTDLPGQAGNVANFALSYQKYGFTSRISLNYHSKYIDIVGKDSDNDIYYDNHLQLDFTANQEIIPGLSAYLQLINLTNEPLRYYIGDTKRPIQREFYSWWMQAGIKYNL